MVDHYETLGTAREGDLLRGRREVVAQGGRGGGGLEVVSEAYHA